MKRPFFLPLSLGILIACASGASRTGLAGPTQAPDPEILIQGEVLGQIGFTAHRYTTRRENGSCWASVLPDGTLVAGTSGRLPQPAPPECCCGDRRLLLDPTSLAALFVALEAAELEVRASEEDGGVSAGGRSAVVLSVPYGVRHLRDPEPILNLVCTACG